MTNREFSDSFDTMLNSYSIQAGFGEGANKQTITLDEYEKGVILTQAQDIIVKSSFDRRANSTGEGFDDSERRQVDFSSLIKNAELTPFQGENNIPFDDRGIIFQLPKKKDAEGAEISDTTDVLFILNEKLIVSTATLIHPGRWRHPATGTDPEKVVEGAYTDAGAMEATGYSDIANAEAAGWYYEEASYNTVTKNYVVVPINYREYDREMSKPFAQPLKKQAWRLFSNQSTGFDVHSEIIPKTFTVPEGATTKYKIRYVKRPRPIILEDLPDGLNIDGISTESSCELNPILHPEILQKAVEIAVATRGGVPQRTQRENG